MNLGDLSHFLLPNSRLRPDVKFLVGEEEVPAHKGILASAHSFFDEMFFGTETTGEIETSRVKVKGDVDPAVFTLFLHHFYGRKFEVAKTTDLPVLVQLHIICCQFWQEELDKRLMKRLQLVLEKEIIGPRGLIEANMLLVKHGVVELLPLVEARMAEIEVGDEDFPGLVTIVVNGGQGAEVGVLHCKWKLTPQTLSQSLTSFYLFLKMAELMVAKYLSKKDCALRLNLGGRELRCIFDIYQSKVVKSESKEKEVKHNTKTEAESMKGEMQKGKMEVMLHKMKTELMVEVKEGVKEMKSAVKEEVLEMKSAVNAELMILRAEVAKSRPVLSLPECPICMQEMVPPTRIIQCLRGHKLCEHCHDKLMRSGRMNCPRHCGTGFNGRDLGMEAFLRQLTGNN